MAILIVDSGSTKCEWSVTGKRSQQSFFTQGMSPYFLGAAQLEAVIRQELLPQAGKLRPEAVCFYGTGTKDPANARVVKTVLEQVWPGIPITVDNDLTGAARALCGHDKGIACILGTGSNSCYFDGQKVVRNSPGLGYVLGDEGSGAYLGKKLVQHYLYGILDNELQAQFEQTYGAGAPVILENVYRQPLPNRYLAGFSHFLSAHRGHYMIENILEDGLGDFFAVHLDRYADAHKYPVHFTGAIAWHFRDLVEQLCVDYGLTLGTILKSPMEGLVRYHRQG